MLTKKKLNKAYKLVKDLDENEFKILVFTLEYKLGFVSNKEYCEKVLKLSDQMLAKLIKGVKNGKEN